MAQDHSVLGLQLLISFPSSSSSAPKWCVHECVLDLLGRAVPMDFYFLLLLFSYEGLFVGLDMRFPNTPQIGIFLA